MTIRSDRLSGCDLSPQLRSHRWFINPALPSLSRERSVRLKAAVSFVRQVFPESHTYNRSCVIPRRFPCASRDCARRLCGGQRARGCAGLELLSHPPAAGRAICGRPATQRPSLTLFICANGVNLVIICCNRFCPRPRDRFSPAGPRAPR